jgi:hypothetical protein
VEIPLVNEAKLGHGWFDAEVGALGEPFRWTSLQWSLEGVCHDPLRPHLLCTVESNFPSPNERILVLADDRPIAEWELVHGRGCYAVAVPPGVETLTFRLSSPLPPELKHHDPRALGVKIFSVAFADRDSTGIFRLASQSASELRRVMRVDESIPDYWCGPCASAAWCRVVSTAHGTG